MQHWLLSFLLLAVATNCLDISPICPNPPLQYIGDPQKNWKVVKTVRTDSGVIRCFETEYFPKSRIDRQVSHISDLFEDPVEQEHVHQQQQQVQMQQDTVKITPDYCMYTFEEDEDYNIGVITVQVCLMKDQPRETHRYEMEAAVAVVRDICNGADSNGFGEHVDYETGLRTRLVFVRPTFSGFLFDPCGFDDTIDEDSVELETTAVVDNDVTSNGDDTQNETVGTIRGANSGPQDQGVLA